MKLFLILTIAALGYAQGPPPPPQPVPFSHQVHAGKLKVPCNTCHANADPGETMGITAPDLCMKCHSSVKTDSLAIRKLTEFAKDKREIRWQRVYEIPTYVTFSHRAHLTSGNKCEECHGAVAERDQLFREVDMSMTGCMNCHSTKGASTDCSYCHDPK